MILTGHDIIRPHLLVKYAYKWPAGLWAHIKATTSLCFRHWIRPHLYIRITAVDHSGCVFYLVFFVNSSLIQLHVAFHFRSNVINLQSPDPLSCWGLGLYEQPDRMISIADRLLHRSFIGLIDVITKDLLSPDLFIMKQLGFITKKKMSFGLWRVIIRNQKA